MITDETRPEDFSNDRQGKYSHIRGWGIDADKTNDPAYPMKLRTNEEHRGCAWERPPLQAETAEILQSVERPNLTAVYGASCPPSGISGRLRRTAYKYSESSYGRWLPLVLADRIDMLEGVADDLSRGHIPNIAKEMGLRSEWRYNRQGLLAKVAVMALIAGTAVALWASAKKSK